ncbi:FecR family protein [Elongatibacter sediminis]|uniref:FecR family protein n=1 Tax=Elongatibacter sediminis TaxID=3119006 RepID=A0AAW9RMI7_9GAMM
MKPDHSTHDKARSKDPEALLESLFSEARVREKPPAEVEDAIRAEVRQAWQQAVGRQRRKRLFAIGAAASVLLAIGFLASGQRPADGPAFPVQVERVIGSAFADTPDGSAGARSQTIAAGLELVPGSVVRTTAGALLALRWASDTRMRLDESTELIVTSTHSVRLRTGAVYVESGAAAAGAEPLIIETAHGRVEPVGTRYMTRVTANATIVSVRAGAVRFGSPVDAGTEPALARSSQRLTATGAAAPRIEPVATWGPDWSWAERLSPVFDADGRSLAALFDWVAAETGRTVRYASPQARRAAADNLLHGSIDLEPLRALQVAAASSGLQTHIDEGELRVDVSPR